MSTKGLRQTTVPHLYRVNYPEQGQVGFLVKLNRKRKKIYEVYNFTRYSNQKECRAAAEAYARWVDQKYPRLSRREVAELRRSNFKNKVVGVRKVTKTVKGHNYEFWEASWSPRPNEVKKKLFSVNKHGNAKARDLALKTRKRGLASMEE